MVEKNGRRCQQQTIHDNLTLLKTCKKKVKKDSGHSKLSRSKVK